MYDQDLVFVNCCGDLKLGDPIYCIMNGGKEATVTGYNAAAMSEFKNHMYLDDDIKYLFTVSFLVDANSYAVRLYFIRYDYVVSARCGTVLCFSNGHI